MIIKKTFTTELEATIDLNDFRKAMEIANQLELVQIARMLQFALKSRGIADVRQLVGESADASDKRLLDLLEAFVNDRTL